MFELVMEYISWALLMLWFERNSEAAELARFKPETILTFRVELRFYLFCDSRLIWLGLMFSGNTWYDDFLWSMKNYFFNFLLLYGVFSLFRFMFFKLKTSYSAISAVDFWFVVKPEVES
jgi:hypothetical protein